jgi:hypothetical protein
MGATWQDTEREPLTQAKENAKGSLFSMLWLQKYQPVFVLLSVSAAAAGALSLRTSDTTFPFMGSFMGMSLTLFAMLKLFDIENFRKSFAKYDLITMRWPQYGNWFPALELFLGLGFLSGIALIPVSILTLIIMAVTATGVFLALLQKKDIACACVGAKVNVPLGVISLVESVTMAVMAIIVLSSLMWAT